MTQCVSVESRERTQGREGYQAGHYECGLATRIGKRELRVS